MLKKRLIACLLIRDGLIVQSIKFKKYLPIGYPKFPLEFVNKWDVDEIVLLDMSATNENNVKALELLSKLNFYKLKIKKDIREIQEIIKTYEEYF